MRTKGKRKFHTIIRSTLIAITLSAFLMTSACQNTRVGPYRYLQLKKLFNVTLDRGTVVTNRETNLFFLIDNSPSMALPQAKLIEAALNFVQSIKDIVANTGVVPRINIMVGTTSDYQAVLLNPTTINTDLSVLRLSNAQVISTYDRVTGAYDPAFETRLIPEIDQSTGTRPLGGLNVGVNGTGLEFVFLSLLLRMKANLDPNNPHPMFPVSRFLGEVDTQIIAVTDEYGLALQGEVQNMADQSPDLDANWQPTTRIGINAFIGGGNVECPRTIGPVDFLLAHCVSHVRMPVTKVVTLLDELLYKYNGNTNQSERQFSIHGGGNTLNIETDPTGAVVNMTGSMVNLRKTGNIDQPPVGAVTDLDSPFWSQYDLWGNKETANAADSLTTSFATPNSQRDSTAFDIADTNAYARVLNTVLQKNIQVNTGFKLEKPPSLIEPFIVKAIRKNGAVETLVRDQHYVLQGINYQSLDFTASYAAYIESVKETAEAVESLEVNYTPALTEELKSRQ